MVMRVIGDYGMKLRCVVHVFAFIHYIVNIATVITFANNGGFSFLNNDEMVNEDNNKNTISLQSWVSSYIFMGVNQRRLFVLLHIVSIFQMWKTHYNF